MFLTPHSLNQPPSSSNPNKEVPEHQNYLSPGFEDCVCEQDEPHALDIYNSTGSIVWKIKQHKATSALKAYVLHGIPGLSKSF